MQNRDRFRFAVLALGLVAIAIVLLGRSPPTTPTDLRPHPKPIESTDAANPTTDQRNEPNWERTLVTGQTVKLKVESSSGGSLAAILVSERGRFRISGEADVPTNLGQSTVVCPGYASQECDVQNLDLRVVLKPGYNVVGRAYDALTELPVRIQLAIRNRDSRVIVTRFATDTQGRFEVQGLPSGDYVLSGEALGYQDVCLKPDAPLSGLYFSVDRRAATIEIPMYPIYAALFACENKTNLEDRVFEAMLLHRSKTISGAQTPNLEKSRLEARIATHAKRSGFRGVVITVRTLLDPADLVPVDADIIFAGAKYTSCSYRLRPICELLQSLDPHVVQIRGRWQTGTLTVASPAPLKVTSRGATFAGGVNLDPGESSLVLPIGNYKVTPRGVGQLLNEREWSANAKVFGDQRISIDPESGYGVIRLRKPQAWDAGILAVSGEGRLFSLWRHAEFPRDVYASPGSYRMRIVTGGEDGTSMKTLWSRKVTVVKGQVIDVAIGKSP